MTKLFSILVLFCALLLSDASAQGHTTEAQLSIERKFIEVFKLKSAEKYEEALTMLHSILEDNDRLPAVYNEISKIYVLTRQFELAEKNAAKAISLSPENIWYLRQAIKVEQYQRDAEGSIVLYKRMIKLEPDNEENYFELAKFQDLQKEYTEALKTLAKIKSDEVNPGVHYRKARIYTKMNKPKKAEKEYLILTDAFPNTKRYWHLLANHYNATGEQEKAEKAFKQILIIDPDDSRASLALANRIKNQGNDVAYLESIMSVINSPNINIDIKIKELIPFVQKANSDPDLALVNILDKYAERIVILHPQEAKAYALRADVQQISGDKMAAIKSYQEALTKDKSVYDVWEQLMFLQSEVKDYKGLMQTSEEVLEYFPNRGRNYYMQALALKSLGKQEEALDVLQQAQIMAGRDKGLFLDSYLLQGNIYSSMEEFGEAEIAYKKALDIFSDHPHVLANYARLLLRTNGDVDKAEQMIHKALEIDNKSLIVALAHSSLFFYKENWEESKSLLEPYMANRTNLSSEVYEHYGDILFQLGDKEGALKYWFKAQSAGSGSTSLTDKIKSKRYIK